MAGRQESTSEQHWRLMYGVSRAGQLVRARSEGRAGTPESSGSGSGSGGGGGASGSGGAMGLARALQIVARHYHSRNASHAPLRAVLWLAAACPCAAGSRCPGAWRHAGGAALRPGAAGAPWGLLLPQRRLGGRRCRLRWRGAAHVWCARLREQQARARGLHVHGGLGRRGRAGTGTQARAGGAPSTSGAPGPATCSSRPPTGGALSQGAMLPHMLPPMPWRRGWACHSAHAPVSHGSWSVSATAERASSCACSPAGPTRRPFDIGPRRKKKRRRDSGASPQGQDRKRRKKSRASEGKQRGAGPDRGSPGPGEL